MENCLKRSQPDVEDELPAKQQKLEENEEEMQPVEKFLEPQLAFEIYSALPIAHQQRLLALWRSIYADEPIAGEWTRWKIYTWADNKWNRKNDSEPSIDLSRPGLTLLDKMRILRVRSENKRKLANIVRAIHPAFPPTIISKEPIQICYFETKLVYGFYKICFCGAGVKLKVDKWDAPHLFYNIFYMFIDGVGPTSRRLPNIRAKGVIGCGLVKHLGKRRTFFTKDGEFLASVPIPMDAPSELFPTYRVYSKRGEHFEDTNFGLNPFLFKYAENEEKILKGLGRDFEKEEAQP